MWQCPLLNSERTLASDFTDLLEFRRSHSNRLFSAGTIRCHKLGAAMNLFQLLFGEWIDLLFGFHGRINRAKYWFTFVIYFVALFALYLLFSLFFSFPTDLLGLVLVSSVPLIPITISSVAVAIKRLHDRNKSGWWVVAFYVLPGVIGNIGPYAGLDTVFQLASLALSIWAVIELGLLRGTSGRNQYGPDPLAPKNVRVRG